MRQLVIFAATAAVLVVCGLTTFEFGPRGTSSSAFAATIEQIQKAETITWRETVYELITNKDGKKYWETEVRRHAFKAPGIYRVSYLDGQGNVSGVEITDAVHKKVLTLALKEKIAVLTEVSHTHCDTEGPFEDAKRMLKEYGLQFVEKQKTQNGDVNVFRKNEGNCFFDCWIDQKTKRLVKYCVNQGGNVTLADYENDFSHNTVTKKNPSRGMIVGGIFDEIDYNADLDDSLFRLDVPEGYSLTTKHRHFVTEQEMIDFIRLLVEANDQIFPDYILDVPSDLFNKLQKKPKAERSPQEQKLLDTIDHYEQMGLRDLPREFLEENADWLSIRYFGKDAQLGDKDRIIYWYKLKHAKDPNIYRVIYGDLSVKDVKAEDLPLPVDP